jgi:hypothetical protein
MSLVKVSRPFLQFIHRNATKLTPARSLTGSFFGGTPHTIKWWRSLYFTYHDRYLSLGIFVGKDQTLINALFLLNPRRIISVWLGDPTPPSPPNSSALDDKRIHSRGLFGSSESNTPLGACGSTWYYYQFFFASESERESMRGRWGSGSGFGLSWGRFRFWSWDWWTVSFHFLSLIFIHFLPYCLRAWNERMLTINHHRERQIPIPIPARQTMGGVD